jgi:leucyl/phenylalanyl-tRNA--protein transferase
LRAEEFEVSVDRDFDAVIAGCAEPGRDRDKTWINARIRRLYGELFDLGHCHTVEVYRDGGLVGGLYGVTLGAAFFGESMFHRERDASKVALAHLVARLRRGGFRLLDTQFVTEHLLQFGAVEVPRRVYKRLLREAVDTPADWCAWPCEVVVPGAEVVRALQDSPA